jgi:hypothetical protein
MANSKISALPAASTPLAGTELVPVVQGGITEQVSVANLTASRAVSALSLTTTGEVSTSGGLRITGPYSANAASQIAFQDVAGAAAMYINGSTTGAANRGTFVMWQQDSAGGNFLQTLGVDVNANVTVTSGNLVIGTSGKGIDFSATPGTGTSELLADYEEGNWTPSVTSSSGSITTVGTVTGKYTKTGNVVTLFGRVTITTNGTGSGAIVVAGLPYSANTSIASYSGYGRDRAISGKQLQVDFVSTGSSFEVYNYDNTYPASNGSTLIFTVLYIAA